MKTEKQYKEVEINSIEDIEVGDIVFYGNNCFAYVIEKGETLLHKHTYILIKSTYQSPHETDTYTERFYADDFRKKQLILRANLKQEVEE